MQPRWQVKRLWRLEHQFSLNLAGYVGRICWQDTLATGCIQPQRLIAEVAAGHQKMQLLPPGRGLNLGDEVPDRRKMWLGNGP
jgi:hypothetical protein